MQLGRVEGRLGALEDRVGRHEKFVGDKLTLIDAKLDRALLHQEQGNTINRAARWIAMLAAGASGWVALFVRGH